MQIHTLDKAEIVSELTVGTNINQAIQSGRRADFSLLLSMFSDDVRDNTPVEQVSEQEQTDLTLRKKFSLSAPQKLTSDENSYAFSATQAEAFHQGGLPSTKLNHYLHSEPLVYQLEDTGNLSEEVYHNLSGHERRRLKEGNKEDLLPFDLYEQLLVSCRKDQLSIRT
ncbi:VC2046/SO_2500 family protein [Vibrio marisflavi]|uniref:Ribosomal S4P (Gammaproteobacterial) n=1 Tax=Vibrio marisflavi CECT 7928 TaxID=634439 RepID=A0ABN8E640_9VIBR|nr:VC2046/SO_2500 family protein [Vibrio marisflavi]CAH0539206.1 hypothetical protein VMF7928_01974 [Vibrio marisflavi CECT 7928]